MNNPIPAKGGNSILILSLLAAALGVVFFPAFTWMYSRFNEHGSYYSHGFLIPLVTAFIIFSKRAELAKLPASPSAWGLPVLVAGLALHIVGGVMLRIGFVSGISLIIVLFGLALYLFGARVTRFLLFPLSFLLVMVPLPNVILIGITFRMKMMAAKIAGWLVTKMGLLVEQAGSIIYLPNGLLTVDDECSGINSLISLLTLSVLFAYFSGVSWRKKSLFVLFAFPVALAANISRIIFLILAAYVYGTRAVHNDILHYGAGIVLWIVALLLLSGLWRVLTWKPVPAETAR